MKKVILTLIVLLGAMEQANAAKATLVVFTAPWCDACNSILKQVEKELPGFTRGDVRPVALVETGLTNTSQPSESVNASYKTELGLTEFEVISDKWQYRTYRKYYGEGQVILPGAILLDGAGDLVKRFTPKAFTAVQLSEEIDKLVGPFDRKTKN